MTTANLCCDRCGQALAGPSWAGQDTSERTGVSMTYHPGDPRLGDNSGLVCQPCREVMTAPLDPARPMNVCAACGVQVHRVTSLHVSFGGDPNHWQLCHEHAVGFLNALRTVEPKLSRQDFRFPLAPDDSR